MTDLDLPALGDADHALLPADGRLLLRHPRLQLSRGGLVLQGESVSLPFTTQYISPQHTTLQYLKTLSC